jgi:hypothetical protein
VFTALSIPSLTPSNSVASLGSLSKCAKLQSLDISTDYHPVEIDRVLSAINSLQQLRRLDLPKNITQQLNTIYNVQKLRVILKWPPNLSHLTMPGASTDSIDAWNALLASFPPSLETLILHQTPFCNSDGIVARAPQLQTFEFGCRSDTPYLYEGFPRMFSLFRIFPRLRKVTFPVNAALYNMMQVDFRSEKNWYHLDTLEVMVIRTIMAQSPSAVGERQMDSATLIIMLGILTHAPRLQRVELGRSRIIFNSVDETALFKSFSEKIKSHAPEELRDSSGVFLVDDSVVGDDASNFGPERWLSRGPRAPDTS